MIPARYRRELGIEDGDQVVLRVEGGELCVAKPSQAMQRFRELVRQYVPQGTMASEDLIAERRAEAERE